ncbi:MAG: 2-phospho-L-lactate transferase CofD family protein, partial [Gammaproteobacteria bacterium]|nr:2-phospho-L-lactate transferase CofD family protein [Gammaproteobacteria bacterium]
TRLLKRGQSLTQITDMLCQRLGVRAALLPMSDDRVRTRVETKDRVLDFQDYFVRQACAPQVTGFDFNGAETAKPNPRALEVLDDPDLAAVIICPSNPFISVDPVLAVPGLRDALLRCAAPTIAVSPIIGGKAVKGPTDKMMRELGLPRTAVAIARHYGELLDGIVLDSEDEASAGEIEVPSICTRTLMHTLDDREQLAREVLRFAHRLRSING